MTIAAELPDDIEELKRLLVADRAEPAAAKAGLLVRTLEVEKLKIQIAQLKRMSFGASSEPMRREVEQLELKLEELETAEAEAEAAAGTALAMTKEPAPEGSPAKKPRVRRHLAQSGRGRHRDFGLRPRPLRGDPPRKARLFLPQMRSHGANADADAADPARPSRAGPRPCAGRGVDLDRPTLADWVGKAAWPVKTIAERIGAHAMAGGVCTPMTVCCRRTQKGWST